MEKKRQSDKLEMTIDVMQENSGGFKAWSDASDATLKGGAT
ncbi:MAG TPA: hypothetical protein VLC94_03610 [Candidatus Acidoferrum sp.]|nr:hypothetical protein [Candidatus Acidoferrum sp.]